MVKANEKEKVEMAKLQALEQENILLKRQLAEQERLQAEQRILSGGNLSNEINKIMRKGRSSADSIRVVEQNDHRNVALWTRDGQCIGPMHPDNAIQTLNRFANIGIMLSADKPTVAQIEAYIKTPEYKAKRKFEDDRSAIRAKSKRSGQMERLATEIAKMSGTTVDAINHILQAHEVVGKK